MKISNLLLNILQLLVVYILFVIFFQFFFSGGVEYILSLFSASLFWKFYDRFSLLILSTVSPSRTLKYNKPRDYSEVTEKDKIARAKKNMLLFGMISLGMSFAGLTSAYIISKERADWLTDFEIPQAFFISLAVIITSSVTFILAKSAVKKEENTKAMLLLVSTFILGAVFVYLQFLGFSQIIENGYFFTGSESSITTSFIYLVVLLHLAHIVAALVSVLVVIYNHYKLKYTNSNTLGIELAATFWHFVDVLWVYLFLFLYFVR